MTQSQTLNPIGEPARTLAVVILNYRTPAMTIDCLETLEPELASRGDARVYVVDNRSGDGSADQIEQAINERGWSAWCELIRSDTNGGFAAGNNLGLRKAHADGGFAHALLLNSDTLVREGAIAELLGAAEQHTDAALIGPRLEWPDGKAQVSAFRFQTPITELINAAAIGVVTRLFARHNTAIDASDRAMPAPWLSFACILIRKDVFETAGLLDEGYFMYFEDTAFCRNAKRAGFAALYWPEAHVVHLRGGSSPVKSAATARKRLPAYFYASRSRYYASFYGRPGLWLANALWLLGRGLSWLRERLGRCSHIAEKASRDIWTNATDPFRPYSPPGAKS
ncbi:MAG: glycosyltransferase family 2 protein [Phycisphaeraceae bacterium]